MITIEIFDSQQFRDIADNRQRFLGGNTRGFSVGTTIQLINRRGRSVYRYVTHVSGEGADCLLSIRPLTSVENAALQTLPTEGG